MLITIQIVGAGPSRPHEYSIGQAGVSQLTDQNGPPLSRDTTLGWSNPKGVQGLWDSGLTPRIHTEKSARLISFR